jgi:hypothetical protein
MSARNTVSIGAILGASGSGKSSLMKLELLAARPPRLLIWDPKGEYGGFAPAVPGTRSAPSSLEDLVRKVCGAGASEKFALSFRPLLSRKAMREQFNVFCLAAERARNCFVLVDELADVTEPGWAPEGWERLTRQGRHAGVTIRGASQRPAEIDKSFLGNASRIAVFRMNAESDVTLLAKILGKDPREVRGLVPLEWFERNMLTGDVTEKKKLTTDQLATLPA